MLALHYPDVKVIHGNVRDSIPQTEAVREAFQEADFFIHGSGPSVVAANYLDAWSASTRKPFGLFGVTIQDITPDLKSTLLKASFIFTRETASIAVLKQHGIQGEFVRFAPDATFALEIHDNKRAEKFLADHKLEARKFICAIPRLRLTPYYLLRANKAGWSDQRIRE